MKYDDELRQTLLKEQEILNTMDEALINGEFIVYYQPKHNIMTNEITGLEALVRWQKKDGNILMPDSFITLFEKNGFITKLDFYV